MSHTSGVKKLKAIATITAAVVDNQHWHSLSFWIWSYFQLQACTYTWHTSKIDVLCSRLNSKETLRNFLYLYKEKTHVVFSFFIFPFMNALVYVDIGQGIHKVKMKVAWNEKQKKILGFSFYINIGLKHFFGI